MLPRPSRVSASMSASVSAPVPVPLVVLTGFLGAGKTTVVNRVLGAEHHRRVAVLVNELGRIDIDAGLIRSRAGDVLELTGGCVCHQVGVRRELWSALADVVARSRPDVVLLETTGIAEPSAILRGLDELGRDWSEGDHPGGGHPATSPPVRAVAVVTVVDAEAGLAQLDRYEEARDQVACADRILLSKIDLAPAAARLGELHRRLFALNPVAERAAFPVGRVGASGLGSWLLDARPAGQRAGRPRAATATATGGAGGARSHAHQLAAATYVDDAPLIADGLLLALHALGPRLVRAKGFVHLAGEPRRGYLERAGDRTRLDLGAPWGEEPPLTRLVLIGEELDEAALQRQLWACRVPPPGAGAPMLVER